jgi:hypothetical protein
MRTTLNIDDSVLAAAKKIAGATRSSMGAVISDLARKGLSTDSGKVSCRKSGFPIFSVPAGARPLTSTTVRSILSDEQLPARR